MDEHMEKFTNIFRPMTGGGHDGVGMAGGGFGLGALLGILLGGRGLFGNNADSNAVSGAVDTQSILGAIGNQTTFNSLATEIANGNQNLASQINTLATTTASNRSVDMMTAGFSSVNASLCGLNSTIQSGFCNTNHNIDMQTASLTANANANTDRILGWLNNNKISDLQFANNDLKDALRDANMRAYCDNHYNGIRAGVSNVSIGSGTATNTGSSNATNNRVN